MRVSVGLLCVSACFCCSVGVVLNANTVDPAEDEEEMLRKAALEAITGVHQEDSAPVANTTQEVKKEVNCSCLTFAEVYSQRGGVCGEGLELVVALNGTFMPSLALISKVKKTVIEEYCTNFYRKMDTSLCVKVAPFGPDMDDWLGQSWCYVDEQCGEEHHTQKVPDKIGKRDFRVKQCEHHHGDYMLGDLPPEQLYLFARNKSLMMGHLVIMAYPRIEGLLAADMAQAWRYGDIFKLPQTLADMIRANKPVVVATQSDGHGDQVVVHGMTAWRVRAIQENDANGFPTLKCPNTTQCMEKDPCNFGCKAGSVQDVLAKMKR